MDATEQVGTHEPSLKRARRGGPGVLKNTIINAAGLSVAHGMSALGGLITARTLGSEGVGILALSFAVIELGRGLTNFTHTPSILEYHRGADAQRVFGTSLMLKLVGSSLFVAALAGASPWLSATFGVPAWAFVLAAVSLALGSFYEIGTARLEADNRMLRGNLLLASGPFVGLVLVAGLAWTGRLTVLTSILSTIVAVSVMSLAFMIDEPRLYRPRYDGRIARYLASYGSRIVAAALLTSGLLRTDTLLVGGLLGAQAAGVYNVVFQITFVMVTASVAIGVALMPALSDLHSRGEDTTKGFQRGTLIALCMSLVLAIAFATLGPLVLGLYGPDFQAGYPILLILLPFGIAAATAVPASSLLTVHGHAGWMTILSLGQLALNIPLNYLLIMHVGLTGAAIATTSVFVTGTTILWYLVYRELKAAPLSWDVVQEAWVEARTYLRGIFD